MKITIYGAGYVGLVTGTCLAELGHEVLCCDINQLRVSQLQQGITPIYEEGLEQLLKNNINNARLSFTSDVQQAVAFASIQMIAVGTPAKADGSSDLQYVDKVAETIGCYMQDYKLVINKSTVLMGTAERVKNIIEAQLVTRHCDIKFNVASNPEFLREGRAIEDFMHPDRVVVGIDSKQSLDLLRELYAPLIEAGYHFLPMKIRSAELTKYAANAFLATKISFMNEMSRIAELFSADILDIKRGIGLDARISPQFLNAGCGFGGSCFPKDVSALQMTAKTQGYDAPILNATLQTNQEQQLYLLKKLQQYFSNDLKGKRIALWGLAFKPNTDDIRCAPSCCLMEALWEEGVSVQAYDPMAMEAIQQVYPDQPLLQLCDSKEAALENADALMIVTEWDEFKHPNWKIVVDSLRQPVVFDGRNLFDAESLESVPVDYFSIGRNAIYRCETEDAMLP
ncbi:MAG: UDP-glucose/GDP-mannose dehydrogenase family protein [Gammaproteobacteria bacterium]|nr:UDP-glucose/GDP-mannose dehydrogenase family protein [Gammaproteobacteria bacterium]MCH9744262.1 UDP-glucose/GDP-mannose dehydrogenase family protein [Gammaproteobacteria bacterium]